MLALTYPDGARVQRCDYLPENEKSASVSPPPTSEYPCRISVSVSDGRPIRARRSPRRRRRTSNDEDEDPARPDQNRAEHERCNDCNDGTESSHELSIRRLHSDTDIDKVNDDASRDGSRRRGELPGRESWPGGSHPKDRSCFLNVVIILVLIMLGSNRHCNIVSRGIAFGTVVAGVGSAPVVDVDAGVRSERSANLSHITGASRKIQMYVKNRHLQILPDGTVNGSTDDTSDFTILQRTSVSRGQLRIQGVATCLYLCMDSCGLLYGSHEYTEDCVFNETIESHNYNTYSSVHWSTPRKTLYLGLSGQGQPRRVQVRGHNLGRLSAYANVLPQVVPQDRVEALYRRMLGAKHNVRHHHGSQQIACPALAPQEKDGRDKFRCRKRKKRKKRRRKCKGGEVPGPQCDARETGVETQSKRSCEGAALDEACRKEALDTPAKKRKSRIEEPDDDFDDDVSIERKSRRSNAPPKKRGKKSATPTPSPKKFNKKKKNLTQSVSVGKNGKNKKKGRSARTTRTLAMTSPLAWYPQTTRATIPEHPKPLASSSSVSSAVSFAATGLASTLSFTVGRINSSTDQPTTVINDVDESLQTQQDEAKDFEDEDEEQEVEVEVEHEDEEEEDDEDEIRLAM